MGIMYESAHKLRAVDPISPDSIHRTDLPRIFNETFLNYWSNLPAIY